MNRMALEGPAVWVSAQAVHGHDAGMLGQPIVEGPHELAVIDQVVLQGQQTKQQIAVGRDRVGLN